MCGVLEGGGSEVLGPKAGWEGSWVGQGGTFELSLREVWNGPEEERCDDLGRDGEGPEGFEDGPGRSLDYRMNMRMTGQSTK